MTKVGKGKASQAHGAWTAEEDRIFLELVAEHVKSKMWEVVKADGRLAYRGGPGVRAHAIAMMNKLKKA